MSVSIQTVEFERREAHLSELEGEPPYTVHGVALGEGDVTVGQSGIKKLWPGEELREAAETLQGTNLVEDHNNGSRGVVGRVTKAGYKEGIGVIYEAELYDEDLAENVANGLLEVSIRGHHIDVDEMEEHEETGAKIVEGIEFANLSIVPTGAAPSNSIDMGETDELSVAELAAFTEELQGEFEPEAGDYVEWGDGMYGIVLTMPDGGEVEVDVYEESDGEYRPIGETEMVSVGDLEEWDVDEENIGPMEDDEEEDEEEASKHGDIPDKYFFESEEDAMNFIEDKDGLTGVHEMDEGYVPGDTHEEFLEWWDNQSSQSGHEEEEMQEGAPDFEEGMMVQWQVNPDMFGKVVHAPDDEDIVMVEVMERMDGEIKPTGFTVTAGYSDLTPFDEEEMRALDELESYSDYPDAAQENAQMALDAREETDNPNDCGTQVGWTRANQLASGEPVSENVVSKMAQFNRHRQNSDMSDGEGEADCGWMMWKAWGGDEGVDWAINKMDEVDEMSADEGDNESDVDELQETEVHRPDFSGTTDSDWSKPALEDFGEDPDLSEVADHFLVSVTGFPPENYGELKLPVVEPNGNLNLNALQNAKARASQTDGLSGDDLERAVSIINSLANEEFDADFEENKRDDGATSEKVSSVRVLTGDDLRQGDKSEESELDETITKVINMTEDIEEKLAELDEPVAVEKSELEDLQETADQFEDMNASLEDLRERTEILDDVDREQVEELADSDEPVVIESTRYEALSDEAEQVKTVYAAALAEAYDVFDAEELTDRFSIEELREKYEENIGDPEEELAPEPRSGDPEEEELEEQANQEEEQLSEEEEQAAEKRAELREKILGGR